jgi:hypothetical protein
MLIAGGRGSIQQKAAIGMAALLHCSKGVRLFYFRFLEGHMLAHDRVVFTEFQLFGLGPRIFLCHIIESGPGGTDEADQYGVRLGHGGKSQSIKSSLAQGQFHMRRKIQSAVIKSSPQMPVGRSVSAK